MRSYQAAWYNTWLLFNLTPKGVVFSFRFRPPSDAKLCLQIRTYHPLAICYNDQSPLENHHLAAASRITILEFRHVFVSIIHVPGNRLTKRC